jgi:hypothetical protein
MAVPVWRGSIANDLVLSYDLSPLRCVHSLREVTEVLT